MDKIPVLYSLFDPDGLNKMLETEYQLNLPVPCRVAFPSLSRFYSRGANDLYTIRARSGDYFLRISQFERQARQVEGEVDLLNGLAAAAIPAPRPVAAVDGRYVRKLQAPEGVRYGVLFERMDGAPAGRQLSESQARALGRSCAQLHQWADGVKCKYERPNLDTVYLFEAPIGLLERLGDLSSEELKLIKAVSNIAAEHCAQLPQAAPYFGLCHGDMIRANALFSHNEAHLLDFDTSGYGWRAYDLATFKVSSTHEETSKNLWPAFLGAYAQVRQPDTRALSAIPYFSIARQIWVMAMHVLIGAHWGHYWVADRMRDGMAQLNVLAAELE